MAFILSVVVAIWGAIIIALLLYIGRLLEVINNRQIKLLNYLEESNLEDTLSRINYQLDKFDRADDWRDW